MRNPKVGVPSEGLLCAAEEVDNQLIDIDGTLPIMEERYVATSLSRDNAVPPPRLNNQDGKETKTGLKLS